MTTIDLDFENNPRSRPGVISKIAKLAFPLMIGAIAAAALHVVKTSVLTYANDTEALFTLSMIQPGFILMLAFLESLAITNQVFASRTVADGTQGDIVKSTRVYSIIGFLLVVILSTAFWTSSFLIGGIWDAGPEIMPKMAMFVLSMFPYLLFELRNGALRGLGLTGTALVPFAVLIVVDIAVTFIGVSYFGLGFDAVMLGNIAGPIAAFPILSVLLGRQTRQGGNADRKKFVKTVIGLTIGVAIPVFGSMVASSVTAAVVFPALANLGEHLASSFFIIVRLRILFIIPAIAIGSAIAILVNQLPEQGSQHEKRSILQTGIITVLAAYSIATFALFALRTEIIGLVVPPSQAKVYAGAIEIMALLIATFALLAGSTMLQVVLEHLRKGVPVLVITILTELVTITAALWVLGQGYGLSGLVWVMNATGVLSFVLMLAVFISLIKALGGQKGAV